MVVEFLTAMGSAAVGGAVWGLIGYIKNKTKDGKPVGFDLKKLALPAIVGAVYGGYAWYTGQQIDVVATGTASLFVVPVVEAILKSLWRGQKTARKKK